ncbi:hypothetical protein BHE74_00027224 [Ensete ventricosum]|nr:hypothetical protein BHE74_00027224 [Ensete ventricosum]RZS05297.1 hypothetical protein BHM03_00035787 [Ensete ventricosum]
MDSSSGSRVVSRTTTCIEHRQRQRTTAVAEETRSMIEEDSEVAGEIIGGGSRGRNRRQRTQREKSSAVATKREACAPETSSILGRASIAGLEKAVAVLDTLGSSMSNLNPSSGFTSGVTARGYKISILAFEVANTIAKGANLWRSLSDENINILKEEVLQSDGVRKLISADANELLWITAADKRWG